MKESLIFKVLKMYLMITSVFVHLAAVVSLFWIIPLFIHSVNVGKEWAESSNTSEIGVVEGVSQIEKGNLKYKGYMVKYKGQDLYVMGVGTDDINKGDSVKVLINEHPYAPLKTLIVTITKK
jgi:hypothetical protein